VYAEERDGRGEETDRGKEGTVPYAHKGIAENFPARQFELCCCRGAVDDGKEKEDEDDLNHNLIRP
jgi:hypothetical protein